MLLVQKTYGSMEQNRELRNKPIQLWSKPLKETKIYKKEKVSSASGREKVGQPQANQSNNTSSYHISSFSSVTQSCPTLCDPMNHSMPGFPVNHQLSEFTQTHVHRVGDAIQPFRFLQSPSPSCPQSLPASGSFPMSQHFA